MISFALNFSYPVMANKEFYKKLYLRRKSKIFPGPRMKLKDLDNFSH